MIKRETKVQSNVDTINISIVRRVIRTIDEWRLQFHPNLRKIVFDGDASLPTNCFIVVEEK